MKINRGQRRFVHALRTLGAAARTELDDHHEHLDVKPSLQGACAFASVMFAKSFTLYMQRHRKRVSDLGRMVHFYRAPLVVCGWFMTSNAVSIQHCWVEIGDIIVDLTATQFGRFPRTRICPRTNFRYASLIAAGRGAESLAKIFEPSPHKRRRLLESMVQRVVARTESELGG